MENQLEKRLKEIDRDIPIMGTRLQELGRFENEIKRVEEFVNSIKIDLNRTDIYIKTRTPISSSLDRISSELKSLKSSLESEIRKQDEIYEKYRREKQDTERRIAEEKRRRR